MRPKIILLGRLGGEWTIRNTQSGKQVANNSLACGYKQGGQEQTMWIRLSAWEKAAETLAKYTGKGGQIYVEGTPKATAYTNKAGEPTAQLEVMVDQFTIIDFKKDSSEDGGGTAGTGRYADDEDIPF